MIGLTHITLADLNCRVWFDHVPSDENPADGLSRDGIHDRWTSEQPWDLREVTLRDYSALLDLPLDALLTRFSEITARTATRDILEAPVAWKIPDQSPDDLQKARSLETERLASNLPTSPCFQPFLSS